MANREKGIHRGGASGMEGELGEESRDMNQGQKRGGTSQQQNPENVGRQILDRGTGRMDDKGMDPDRPSDRPRSRQPGETNLDDRGSRPLGETGLDQGAQRGGLRREPDLEGVEAATGHETD
jgi:hypothetical protein